MTHDRIALCDLLEKSADADPLREMIGFAVERLMKLAVQGLPQTRSISSSNMGVS